jgi:hypothetical protein
VSQENSPEHSPQLVSAQEIRPASSPSRKRLLALVAICLAISSTAAAVYFIKLKPAHAGFERILPSKSTSLAGSPAGIPQHAKESPIVTAPQQQTSLSAEEQAQKIWTEFDKTTWEATLEAWSSLHPEVSCKSFHGRMWGLGADAQWSHRCSSGPQPEAAHWSFYVFGLQEPLAPRLEQFDVFTVSLPEETLTALQNSLQNRLAARFGPGEDRSPKTVRARAVSWPEHLRWQAADVEIQLNVSEFDPQRKEGRLRLQARHRALLEAMKDDERLKLVGAPGSWYEVGSAIDKVLADNLRPDFPQAATMLVKSQPDPDPQKVLEAVQQAIQQRQSQLKAAPPSGQRPIAAIAVAIAAPPTKWTAEEFHEALVRLLTSVKTAARDRQPILLLAADRLAGRLPSVILNDKSNDWDWSVWRRELSTFGVTYEQASEEPWAYGGSLLQHVWTGYGETEWGQRAFLLLLSQGFDTSVDCKAGRDQFRKVIPEGLQFLERHADSPHRLDVQLAVAQAYETWWSLSQAPAPGQAQTEAEEAEPDANPQQYQESAEAARQQAIARYEQFLQTAPQSDYAAYARRVLPRLKLGIDTGQRRFYCVMMD